MWQSVCTVTFLCGNQQAFLLGPGNLDRGDVILLAPEANQNHRWAVAAKNGQGMHIGRIAREWAKGLHHLLAAAKRVGIWYDVRFLRFVNKERKSKYNERTYISVNVDIEVRFWHKDCSAILEALSNVAHNYDIELEVL